jgi:hypothetical protein
MKDFAKIIGYSVLEPSSFDKSSARRLVVYVALALNAGSISVSVWLLFTRFMTGSSSKWNVKV